MLDFPDTPTADQEFESWRWDAVLGRWRRLGAAGGGGGGPAMGVTDGSNAALGEIGEFFVNQYLSGALVLTTNLWATVLELNLPAGDFDVWGAAGMQVGGGSNATRMQARMELTNPPVIGPTISDSFTAPQFFSEMLALPALRRSSDVPGTASINLNVTFTGTAVLPQAYVWARRMR